MLFVLVVDDDPHIRTLVCRVLAKHGYATMPAVNGEDALARMREHKPCVVILDLQMPVVDGWEFRRRQLADPSLAHVPVICITGYYDEADVFRRSGVECLNKPLQLSDLLRAVDKACGRDEAGAVGG